MSYDELVEAAAASAYEVIRICERTLSGKRMLGWEALSARRKSNFRSWVRLALYGASAEEAHGQWMSRKVEQGWTFGLVKDREKKTHPLLATFDTLPEKHKCRKKLFMLVAREVGGALSLCDYLFTGEKRKVGE